MLDFSRFRPILLVGLGILVSLALINFLFVALSARSLAWTKETPHDLQQSETGTGANVAGIMQIMRQEAPGVPLNLVLGQSTAVVDIDCGILTKECASPSRWFAVRGFGASFVKMSYALHPLFRSGLHPRICLLVIDPLYLAGNYAVRTLPDHKPVVNMDRAYLHRKALVWLAANRNYVNAIIQVACDTARERMMGSLSLPVDATYAPAKVGLSSDPFHPTEAERYKGHTDPVTLARYLDLYEADGYFSAEMYHLDGEQAEAFLDIIDQCRRIGAKVVVQIEPAPPAMRQRVPPEAEAYLEQLLAKARSTGPLIVLNMRTSQPPANFNDTQHLNAEGRQSNTENLVLQLKAEFGSKYGADY